GAALAGQPPHRTARQGRDVVLNQAAEAVLDAEEGVLVDPVALEHGAADHRVESGAVAAAGQDADSHAHSLAGPTRSPRARPVDRAGRGTACWGGGRRPRPV